MGTLKPLPGDEDEPFTPNSPAFMRAYLAAIEAPAKARTAGTFQSLTILTAPNGKPSRTDPKPTHFQHEWRKATLAAGLDGLHFHDSRGTTCTLLAEAGATPSEIAAMLGWTMAMVNQMLDTYQAMTRSLSDSAVAKLERGTPARRARAEARSGCAVAAALIVKGMEVHEHRDRSADAQTVRLGMT